MHKERDICNVHSRLEPAIRQPRAVQRIVDVFAPWRVDGHHRYVSEVCALCHH